MEVNNPKPGWAYKYSENIQQNVAFNKTTGWVYCEDGTKYSPEECQLLRSVNQTIPVEVHLIKKVFGGTLIEAVKN